MLAGAIGPGPTIAVDAVSFAMLERRLPHPPPVEPPPRSETIS